MAAQNNDDLPIAEERVAHKPSRKIKGAKGKVDKQTIKKRIEEDVQELMDFVKEKKESKELKEDDHLVIFIHGFNNDNNTIFTRLDEMDAEMESDQVVITAFNWQSACWVFAYSTDKKEAAACAEPFALYLEEIRHHKDHTFRKIDIVSHSMGNYLLVKSIFYCDDKNLLPIFADCNIICIAPDVNKHKYEKAIELLLQDGNEIVSKWIHYYNRTDAALYVSKYANIKTFIQRAGAVSLNIAGNKFHQYNWNKTGDHGYVSDVFKDVKSHNILKSWIKRNLSKESPQSDNGAGFDDDDKKNDEDNDDEEAMRDLLEKYKFLKTKDGKDTYKVLAKEGGFDTWSSWRDANPNLLKLIGFDEDHDVPKFMKIVKELQQDNGNTKENEEEIDKMKELLKDHGLEKIKNGKDTLEMLRDKVGADSLNDWKDVTADDLKEAGFDVDEDIPKFMKIVGELNANKENKD